MSRNRKLLQGFQNFYQKLRGSSVATMREQKLWLLRTFLVTKQRPELANSGFVLPMVVMVSLVVVLLTVAILFRSFERSKNASNVRVNETVLKSATPAIDRAKAKIEQMFVDPTLPRYTPSESSLYNAFIKDIRKYTFGDETPLTLSYNTDGQGGIRTTGTLDEKEIIQTAWRFPVDTDNNGKFDSYTLYGIYLRSPSRGDTGQFNRARNPLEARTPPMDDGTLGDVCAAAKGTSASLVGESGWYRTGGNLKKSFFVYTATVPITGENNLPNNFENNQGNKGFSALEFQQDQERVPIVSNAVVYEDDLEITPGAGLRLNGSIFGNSNLLTARTSADIRLFQVSSPASCFYRPENSKITIAGNVGNGRITGDGEGNDVIVDLFKTKPEPFNGTINITSLNINATNKSANNTAAQMAYNTRAYAERINGLVAQHVGNGVIPYTNFATYLTTAGITDPREVRDNVRARIDENPSLNNQEDVARLRRQELESYFEKRTRRVPFAEVSQTQTAGVATLQGTVDSLRPVDSWVFPFNVNTGLTLRLNQLPATQPITLKEVHKNEEKRLGDRIVVGNNLPALWFDAARGAFVGKNAEQRVDNTTEWDEWTDGNKRIRYRSTRVDKLIDLGNVTQRDEFFEDKATERPRNNLDNVGGMRVITGAGIYADGADADPGAQFPWDGAPGSNEWTPRTPASGEPRSIYATDRPGWDLSFVDPNNADPNRVSVSSLQFQSLNPVIVWPDSMPKVGSNGATAQKGDLLMRASAVYHYALETDPNNSNDQKPIACVSSYYNPSNATTAQNASGLRTRWANPNAADIDGGSNNGIVYPVYTGTRAAAITANLATLQRQARLVFPNGRFVNENLRQALINHAASRPLSMAEKSAIDTAVCGIQILNGATPATNPLVPHGAIHETAFLDARQVKSLESEANVNAVGAEPNYDRSIEQRQPLEVRTTVIDLNLLRTTSITGPNVVTGTEEFLLPNSGLIYASREDALADLSVSPSQNISERRLISPTDHRLDPTRRPNGIMLINGSNLERVTTFREEEKGLILASNVPVYVKGDFNLHRRSGSTAVIEEFTQTLAANWNNFYTRATLEPDFACRRNDPRLPSTACPNGDTWRPASVIADAVTVLSGNFREGFRDEGDYDVRNNQFTAVVQNYDWNGDGDSIDTISEVVTNVDLNGDGDRTDTAVSEVDQIAATAALRKQGFYDNNYLTNNDWFGTSPNGMPGTRDYDAVRTGVQGSSYVHNLVTPIQRRVEFSEYLMEKCPIIPASRCNTNDWTIGSGRRATEAIGEAFNINTHTAGTTVELAAPQFRRFARRVAFARTNTGNLILDNNGHPIPLGLDTDGNIRAFASNPVGNVGITTTSGLPRTRANALWFRTAESLPNNGNSPTGTNTTNYGHSFPLFYQTVNGGRLTDNLQQQPILVPVLQVHITVPSSPGADLGDLPSRTQRGQAQDQEWIQRATETTTNLIFAGGDTPGRASINTGDEEESNGGLENFVRYLEVWEQRNGGTATAVSSRISGSLIQYKRSEFATAPWQTVTYNGNNASGRSIYAVGNNNDGYDQFYRIRTTPFPNGGGGGMSPFYVPPNRRWGFDTAILSQLPDLFAQQFTLPPSSNPNEFFREVNRDDPWVQTLLCAKVTDTNNLEAAPNTLTNAVPTNQRPEAFCDQRSGG